MSLEDDDGNLTADELQDILNKIKNMGFETMFHQPKMAPREANANARGMANLVYNWYIAFQAEGFSENQAWHLSTNLLFQTMANQQFIQATREDRANGTDGCSGH